jgi:hypothetical protein
MSLLFWRKSVEVAGGKSNEQPVVVSTSDPLPVQLVYSDENAASPVQIVQDYMPPVAGQTVSRMVKVPGITAAAAHHAGDAFGTMITFRDVFRQEKKSGVIVSVLLHDLDDENSQVDVPLFAMPFTATADDAAFAPSDTDNLFCKGTISITTFANWGNNGLGEWNGSKWMKSEDGNLYTQLITQSTPNIAAGADPWIEIVVIPD